MTFALDLLAFAEKAGKRADEAVGRVVIGVAAEIDALSPVGDAAYWISKPPNGYAGGHFRGNWQLGVDTVPAGEIPGIDPSGGETQGRIVAEIPERAGGHVYWIANNAPYAMRLEAGYSRQAPRGMVGLTALKFQQIVNEAAVVAQQAHP